MKLQATPDGNKAHGSGVPAGMSDNEVYVPGALYIDDDGVHWRCIYDEHFKVVAWVNIKTGCRAAHDVPKRPLRLLQAPLPEEVPEPAAISPDELRDVLARLREYRKVEVKIQAGRERPGWTPGWNAALNAVEKLLGL